MVALAVRKEPVKVLLPATLWSVLRSTKVWVVEPVPPLATATMPVREMLGVCPPLEASGPLAPTVSTPVLAMVTLPTPLLFTLMPAPATLLNTPALLTVGLAAVHPIAMPAFPEVTELTPFTAPVDPLKLSTPVLATVGLLAVPPMLIPVLPDATESTPVLLRVRVPPRDNEPPPESPVLVVMVTELFCNAVLGMLLTFAPEIPVRPEPSPE